MANDIRIQYAPLLALPRNQRLPSITATVCSLPQTRTRVEVLAFLYLQLRAHAREGSGRDASAVQALFLRECSAFLAQNEAAVSHIQFEAEDTHLLTPTIVSMSAALLQLQAHNLSLLPSLPSHLLLAISHSLNDPSALPLFTRLLATIPLSPSHAAPLLLLLSYISSLPSSPLLLLTSTSLSLSLLTSLLTHPHANSPALTSQILQHLSHFARVIWEEYAGVAGGFPQLLRVFYGCADVLSTSPPEAESCLRALIAQLKQAPTPSNASQEAYLFTLAETLLPILSPSLVYTNLLPLCIPALDNPAEKGAFEASHSLFLVILAMPKKGQAQMESTLNVQETVPYYISCLLKHLAETHLSPVQFRLAYTSLVQTCASLPPSLPSPSVSSLSNEGPTTTPEGKALAWFCVQQLLSALRDLTFLPKRELDYEYENEKVSALRETLVALVPVVPPSLLPHTLEGVEVYVLRPLRHPTHPTHAEQEQQEQEQKQERSPSDRQVLKTLFAVIRAVGEESRGEALGWFLGVVQRLGLGEEKEEVRARM
ncbi:hypothetical protein DACRYDRAFT_110706 [Dacryopinax primogenitus]|uniref:Uncharacterized protein n=1 Tax=Dacryopinax primogenitus (strain DJM 731) TaxID=1858805 RepID=M5G4Y9_DACPD|nr:uncharacterized protein DACRYDRAFT_110706 [Dacryopinax primogenitus]EJT98817.1 hypothetical protein DACRYDRAFT_110706 [Dacryopinax primogenitus]